VTEQGDRKIEERSKTCLRADTHRQMLRHTALTRLLQQTGNVALVQKYAGHSDIRTTLRYAHILDGELREATRAFTMPAIASFTGSKTTPEPHPMPCDATAVSQPAAPQALGTCDSDTTAK